MHVPHALPTLRVSNGEDAYAFVGVVSFDAKSCGVCRAADARRVASLADVDVGVDAGANAAVVLLDRRRVGRDGDDGGCSGSGVRAGRMWWVSGQWTGAWRDQVLRRERDCSSYE